MITRGRMDYAFALVVREMANVARAMPKSAKTMEIIHAREML